MKRDIETLRLEVSALRSDVQRDMKELEYKLTIRLGAMLAASVAVVAALVKLL